MGRATLTFLGAAGTVTGSCYLLAFDGRAILVDAGLFQGEKQLRLRNWEPFPVDPATISDVLLTHAHLDHSGYLPALVRAGFTGRIWCTEGTARLTEIILRDSAYLQEQDARYAHRGGWSKHRPPLALYGIRHVEATLPHFRTIPFDADVDLGGGCTARFTRAGHILGAASIRVQTPGTSVLFSGDLGRHDHPVLRSRDTPRGADYVVVESTYGDREHPEPEGPSHAAFADAINRAAARGGSVVVPAFAVDRTEVVLLALAQMRREGRIPDVPVIVDSPMALAALRVYRDAGLRGELRPQPSGLDLDDLSHLREAHTKEESMALNDPATPCVIISASGMATGGRVLHHLAHLLPDDRNAVVLTGYQASGTRGRALAGGARQLKMHGRYVPVEARIVVDDEFSVHADASDLHDWLADLDRGPVTLFVTHGEEHAALAVADAATADFGWTAVVPRHGEIVAL